MEIKMLAGYTGPDYILAPGERRDFPKDKAVTLIKAGLAVPVGERRFNTMVKPSASETRR
ncbi:hypothetical protein [Martelella mangrovi]|uniref:Uncharacterized protein n=1 Tax=Martelella mangrovi TaxID=1397477 RepID=A0ABV2IGU7_9HYPH